MADITRILAYIAKEIVIEVLEGDMLDEGSSTISVTDADDEDVNLLDYAEVRLDIFDDKRYQSRVYRFSNLEGSLVRGDGFFSLYATPFPLKWGSYKFKLQALISTGNYKTLGYGDFKILNI